VISDYTDVVDYSNVIDFESIEANMGQHGRSNEFHQWGECKYDRRNRLLLSLVITPKSYITTPYTITIKDGATVVNSIANVTGNQTFLTAAL
jgi:hypothetical protein